MTLVILRPKHRASPGTKTSLSMFTEVALLEFSLSTGWVGGSYQDKETRLEHLVNLSRS